MASKDQNLGPCCNRAHCVFKIDQMPDGIRKPLPKRAEGGETMFAQINNRSGAFELWIDGKNLSGDVSRVELILDTEKLPILRVDYIAKDLEAKLGDKIAQFRRTD